jgi:tetratricopeptide (TPR) repeat protein
MELSDEPNFTVAGVTDYTNLGGHGADTTLRASEALTKQTLTLKSGLAGGASPAELTPTREKELVAAQARDPQSFEANRQLGEFCLASKHYGDAIPALEAAYHINPQNSANAYDLALAYMGSGELARARRLAGTLPANGPVLRLLADLDEQAGNSLAAENEYERATRVDPSEQNYFDWGTELLLHRAIEPAQQVFAKGAVAHPDSLRMLDGLGVALYAGGSYEEAARRLCAATELGPGDETAYIFLGKMEKALPAALPCSEQKLARFVGEYPENALANYFYAVSLWKRARGAQDPERLAQIERLLAKAIKIDPRFDVAYLQLGILYSSESKTEEAKKAYQKAIELNPRSGEAHYRLGLEYKKAGKTAQASEEFRLHQEAENSEAAAIESQRRELRQFVVILKKQ